MPARTDHDDRHSNSILLAAGFVGALGVLIECYGMVTLIAGYDPNAVDDEEGLGDVVGTNALYVAALTLADAAVEYADPVDGAGAIWIAFILGVGLLTIRMVRGARRYETTT